MNSRGKSGAYVGTLGWRVLALAIGSATVVSAPAHAGLPPCGYIMKNNINNLSPIRGLSATPVTVTEGVNPPSPYLASGLLPGTTLTCNMGANKTVAIIAGPYLNGNKYWTKRNGLWRPTDTGFTTGERWGPDENYYCSLVAYSQQCFAVKSTIAGPLVCVGLDGVKTATASDGVMSKYGGATATVSCVDRPNGGGVQITLPSLNIELHSTSASGYVAGNTPGYDQQLTFGDGKIYLPTYSINLGLSATGPAGSPSCPYNGSNHDGSDTGPCTIPYGTSNTKFQLTPTYLSSGNCTVTLDNNRLDWGTVNPGGGLTPGEPLPGVQTLQRSLGITCTGGGSENAALVTVTPHGSSDWRPDVFDSSNDSIGYKLSVGNRNVALTNHTQIVLKGADGIQFQPTGGNTVASTTITATPVAKQAELLPGTATANITLDVYAVANQ